MSIDREEILQNLLSNLEETIQQDQHLSIQHSPTTDNDQDDRLQQFSSWDLEGHFDQINTHLHRSNLRSLSWVFRFLVPSLVFVRDEEENWKAKIELVEENRFVFVDC